MNLIKRSGLASVGLLSAFTASLCCITPLLALITGAFSLSLSWLEPARPYLIGFTIAVLAFAWYRQLVRDLRREEDCECQPIKTSFMNSKKTLAIITLSSLILLTFPYYGFALYQSPGKLTKTQQPSNLKSVYFSVKGMSCEACTKHIDGNLSKVSGVASSSTSYVKGITRIIYDPKKVSEDSLKAQINQTGYQVTGDKK